MASEVNIKVVNELGEVVYPQGVDWEKWKKRLKNALDWLSRPHGKSVLQGCPVLSFTASPAFTGGVRAHQQLNETLWAIQALQVVYPQIVIGNVTGKIDQGQLRDESARAFLLDGVGVLITQIANAPMRGRSRCS